MAALVMAAAGVGSYEIVRRHIRGETVKTPLIKDDSLKVALDKLADRGLTLEKGSSVQMVDVPPGIVLNQSPLPDTLVKVGSAVRVDISAGAESQGIPELRGLEFKEAELRLEQSGFKSGRISSIESPGLERGLALASEPPARANAPRGTAVNLLISSGAPAREIAMPRLLGRSFQEAAEILSRLGLGPPEAIAEPGLPGREGLVVRQSPNPGARLESANRITVVVGS